MGTFVSCFVEYRTRCHRVLSIYAKNIFTCLILLVITDNVSGTTAVIVTTKTAVILGADSAEIQAEIEPRTGKVHISRTRVCKITTVRNTAFAFSGTAYDKAAMLDVERIVKEVLSTESNLPRAAEAAAKRIEGPLLLALVLMHDKLTGAQFAKAVGTTKSVLSVGIARFDNGAPTFTSAEFIVENDAKGAPASIKYVIRTYGPNNYSIMGQQEAVTKLINAGGFWSNDQAADLRRIIDIEIHDVPELVGPPIDILSLDSKGHHWLPPYGECDQQH